MVSAHSEIQEIQTEGYQDVEEADADLEAAWAALDPEPVEVYTGRGFLIASDIEKRYNVGGTTARKRARKAVARGTMVETHVDNPDQNGRPFIQAWVPTQLYNEWKRNNDDSNGAGERQSES